MRAMVNKYKSFLFHPHVLWIVGAAFLPFLLGAAVYAEDINNRSDRGSILEDRLSTNRASAASSHSCLECKPGYAASSGEYEGKASGGTEDAEMAAMELDLSSGAISRTKEGSTSTPAFRCPETTPVTEALTGAGLINLFVSLGIVTVEKASEVCRSLARETISSIPTRYGTFRFSRPLAEGMASPDVRELQRFLNAQGFGLSEEGPGSPGYETQVFGELTVDAVKRFQATYSAEILDPEGLSAPSGVFGPSSIKKANEILSARKYARPRDGHRPSALK